MTVLIASHNGAATLPAVLDAYCRLTAPPGGWSLLLIDNDSDDATAALAAAYAARLPLRVLREGRRGKNAALNTGLAAALADGAGSDPNGLLVFSDDDAAPAPDWLLRLSEAAAAQPGFAVFGGAIVADWGAAPPDWVLRQVPLGLTYGLTAPELAEGPVFPGLVWGANMAVRRAVFEAGHRFDEGIGPNGASYAMGSETELTRRLHAAGQRSWFCPAAVVAHHIRPAQLRVDDILRRAWRFGRGKLRQDPPGVFPQLLGVPRWMYKRALLEALGWLRAGADTERRFRHRWELAFLRGYMREAWFGPPRGGKKILITSYSGGLGGMELRMAQESRFLAAAGYRSALALRRFAGFERWAGTLRREGMEVSVFAPPCFFEQWEWRRLNLWRARCWAWLALRRRRADLVHVAFCWTHYGASALWLAQRCGLAAVISVHNAFPPAKVSDWHRPLLRQAFGRVRGVYAVSDSAMQHFLALYRDYLPATARLAVIPNCVDTARFRPSAALRATARLRLGLPAGALLLGSVARLAEQKRPQALLALLAALLPQFPQLYLLLIGDGPLEAALRRQAERDGLTARVLFAGFQTEVEQWLPALDLHLLLSRNEGFGIATIEAMACGVPAVGSDVPGTADVLRGSAGGLLVPLDDALATAAGVAALLADPQRRARMGRLARAEVEARYAVALVGERVAAFYRGLL
ncbi:glycosyltransferase [Rugamonas sp. CCM 8940]|uniref:glycosyltransferase n=1 Tax=Rugamonas sp. CCM 8940 TaxID=2765359 RepID=UPI001F3F0BAD|nr:glycosyltransferase [Rugamonas sp. CCM 8940]